MRQNDDDGVDENDSDEKKIYRLRANATEQIVTSSKQMMMSVYWREEGKEHDTDRSRTKK